MDMAVADDVLNQHLIDPEICIRCNTCEATCPVGAITHDSRNYVVDAGQVQPVHGLHPAVPHRLDRQLAARADACAPTRSKSSSAGTCCRPSCRPTQLRDAGAPAAQAGAGGAAGRAGGTRRDRVLAAPTATPRCRRGRPRTPTPTSTARRAPTTRHGGRQLPRHRGRPRVRHAPHRARLRRDAVPGARRPVDRHRAARRRRARPRAPRAPVLDRQPAQRRAPGLQQPVAHRQARARGPPGPAGARRGEQLPVRPEGRRQRCR